jgi:NAD-dependent dihydropyrimidine dehydrogenase PreA subunit
MHSVESGMSKVKKILQRFLRPSTWSFLKEARQTPGFTLFNTLHGYVYGRWPYLYIGIGTGEHPINRLLQPLVRFFQWLFPSNGNVDPERLSFADTYHGKVLTTKAARQLVTVKEDIHLKDLEHVIPYAIARDIILKNPSHIVVLECPCRASRPDPCLPLDVCMIIGEPFAGFVIEHHPRRARWITGEEAEEILEAEHARGHVHHAFFKDAMFGRFYAICNCCSCCCGAMQAMRHGTPMLAASGYVRQVDEDLCVNCGDCVEACPFDAIEMGEDGVEGDLRKCMGCGVCVSVCPEGAISLVRDFESCEPLEIQRLLAETETAQDLHETFSPLPRIEEQQ